MVTRVFMALLELLALMVAMGAWRRGRRRVQVFHRFLGRSGSVTKAAMVSKSALVTRRFTAAREFLAFMVARALLAGRETLATMVTSGVGGEDRGFHGLHCRLAAGPKRKSPGRARGSQCKESLKVFTR
jgi:hypothetical protein